MGFERTGSIKTRSTVIDMIKGISIIAVVLYHMGLLKTGYLGVDCFFVIGGFLTMPKIIRGISDESFKYFKYIRSRIIRLLPMILLVSIISLAIGYVLWLPNDYENLAETVIASTFFSNNILSGITTKNYWDAINEYKPLMHMWYIGILMEYYILLPIIAIMLKKLADAIKKNKETIITCGIGIVTVASLLMFFMPFFSTGDKFYFIPFRFWELALGGFIGLYQAKLGRLFNKNKLAFSIISFTAIIVILCIGLVGFDIAKVGVSTTIIGADTVASSDAILPNNILLISMVMMTCIFLLSTSDVSFFGKSIILSAVGKRSFSFFIWHQTMLALYRYSVTNRLSVLYVICFVLLLGLLSELSYRFIENRIKNTKKSFIILVMIALLTCGCSGVIYLRAGVVRDIPELGVTTDNIQRNMHSKYCDRIYSHKDDFEDNGNINVLIVGNSFARDWGNILLESAYGNHINMYFSSHFDESLIDRVKTADRIFVFENYEDKTPDYVWDNTDRDIVYCIGTKNFGVSNGTIYFHRFSEYYFDQTVPLDLGYKLLNDAKTEIWNDHYIDLIAPVLKDGKVKIFTEDHMFISQDCRHLTEAGAKYYAQLLDISQFMPKK